MPLKYILVILIITICIVSIIHKKTILSSFRNINSIAYDQTVFLLNVSNYTQWAINFNNYIPDALVVYINNSNVNELCNFVYICKCNVNCL